jgi:hypothetical protein
MRAERPGSYSMVTTVAGMPMLVALEIDGAQQALVAAAAKAHGRVAGIAASAGADLALHQRLVRLRRGNVVGRNRGAIAQRLGCRSVSFNGHVSAHCL